MTKEEVVATVNNQAWYLYRLSLTWCRSMSYFLLAMTPHRVCLDCFFHPRKCWPIRDFSKYDGMLNQWTTPRGVINFASMHIQWILIELARHTEIQTKLREELSTFSSEDPTWEHLTHELPYLDAVVHEVLRLHPPGTELMRIVYAHSLYLYTITYTLFIGSWGWYTPSEHSYSNSFRPDCR